MPLYTPSHLLTFSGSSHRPQSTNGTMSPPKHEAIMFQYHLDGLPPLIFEFFHENMPWGRMPDNIFRSNVQVNIYMRVSWNGGTPKSSTVKWDFPWNKPSILRYPPWLWKPPYRWFSLQNFHVCWFQGTHISGNLHILPSGKLTVRYWKWP